MDENNKLDRTPEDQEKNQDPQNDLNSGDTNDPGDMAEDHQSQKPEDINILQEQHTEALRERDQFRSMAQRAMADLANYKKRTIEEMEEYEPHIKLGTIVYAGVDYETILRQAEQESDIILWDGGNNDLPFYQTDLLIVVVDPHRVGHEKTYYPGETNLRLADVVVINKIDSAKPENVETLKQTISSINPSASIVDAESLITVENINIISGKKVLVVEDGPTLTHDEMKYGAGVVAAKKYGASELIDPREYAVGKLSETFEHYPNIGTLLPAMGYGNKQVKDLETTINNTECQGVIIGTPIDLRRIIDIQHPNTRVTYDLQEIGHPTLDEILIPFLN